MNELALFAGAGGGILGGQLLGWRTVCAVERDAYAAAILAQRQNEGLLDLFPIWSDITTFDGKPWAGIVEVISGGFPCQDISVAGKGAGIEGARSGLWGEMERIISEVRPRFVFVENSPALTLRGLGRVLGDLAAMGYDAEWGVLGASDVGAQHKRERIWILAHTELRRISVRRGIDTTCKKVDKPQGISIDESQGLQEQERKILADSNDEQSQRGPEKQILRKRDLSREYRRGGTEFDGVWPTEPNVGRVANGVAFKVDRLKAIGNGQVPQCAAEAWRRLMERSNDRMRRLP